MRLSRTIALVALVCFAASVGVRAAAAGQSGRERVDGVTNFGRVTDRYFRGGKVTPTGVENLAKLGVRTIVDLRDEPSPGEPEACERAGITYHKFPMDGHATPDPNVVDQILAIIRDSKAPVYVHCSAGKHRAGTICALYRMRIQGWTEEKAWAEQQSYGFGAKQEHPELFAYAYGGGEPSAQPSDALGLAGLEVRALASGAVGQSVGATAAARAAEPAAAALSPTASYMPLRDMISKARQQGGEGEVLKIDLEYDITRSVATWDVTFSSGLEYEFDAQTGAFLGSKQKAASKIATMLPIGDAAKSFHDVMSAAEASAGQRVLEMELKHVKGTPNTVYEVVFADGVTIYYHAETGAKIDSM